MLTKAEKKDQIDLGAKKIKESESLIFADFTGVPTKDVNQLKSELRKAGAAFKVFKKRLLNLAMKQAGYDFDPSQFDAQVGTVFVKGDISSVAAPIYKFAKELAKKKKNFKVLGAYDLAKKSYMAVEEFTVLAKLPSREVLLAMVVGAMSGPIRAFMYILSELSKKTAGSSPVVMEEKVVTQ